jgi:hypothetical protein
MDTPFPVVKRYDYPKLDAVTLKTGRTYLTPHGVHVPSVTTILGILPKDGLIAWRERIGDEEADRIVEEACDIGTTMHDMLEGYVGNYLSGRPNTPPETDNEKLAYKMAQTIITYGLEDQLNTVWGIEEALYCESLYAGRTDLIGIYKGKSAIIDYKSARMWKKPEWIEGYKMQLAAYNFCHHAMFGERMETGVLLIAIRPGNRNMQTIQRVIVNKSDMAKYEEKWLDVVERYYAEKNIKL